MMRQSFPQNFRDIADVQEVFEPPKTHNGPFNEVSNHNHHAVEKPKMKKKKKKWWKAIVVTKKKMKRSKYHPESFEPNPRSPQYHLPPVASNNNNYEVDEKCSHSGDNHLQNQSALMYSEDIPNSQNQMNTKHSPYLDMLNLRQKYQHTNAALSGINMGRSIIDTPQESVETQEMEDLVKTWQESPWTSAKKKNDKFHFIMHNVPAAVDKPNSHVEEEVRAASYTQRTTDLVQNIHFKRKNIDLFNQTLNSYVSLGQESGDERECSSPLSKASRDVCSLLLSQDKEGDDDDLEYVLHSCTKQKLSKDGGCQHYDPSTEENSTETTTMLLIPKHIYNLDKWKSTSHNMSDYHSPKPDENEEDTKDCASLQDGIASLNSIQKACNPFPVSTTYETSSPGDPPQVRKLTFLSPNPDNDIDTPYDNDLPNLLPTPEQEKEQEELYYWVEPTLSSSDQHNLKKNINSKKEEKEMNKAPSSSYDLTCKNVASHVIITNDEGEQGHRLSINNTGNDNKNTEEESGNRDITSVQDRPPSPLISKPSMEEDGQEQHKKSYVSVHHPNGNSNNENIILVHSNILRNKKQRHDGKPPVLEIFQESIHDDDNDTMSTTTMTEILLMASSSSMSSTPSIEQPKQREQKSQKLKHQLKEKVPLSRQAMSNGSFLFQKNYCIPSNRDSRNHENITGHEILNTAQKLSKISTTPSQQRYLFLNKKKQNDNNLSLLHAPQATSVTHEESLKNVDNSKSKASSDFANNFINKNSGKTKNENVLSMTSKHSINSSTLRYEESSGRFLRWKQGRQKKQDDVENLMKNTTVAENNTKESKENYKDLPSEDVPTQTKTETNIKDKATNHVHYQFAKNVEEKDYGRKSSVNLTTQHDEIHRTNTKFTPILKQHQRDNYNHEAMKMKSILKPTSFHHNNVHYDDANNDDTESKYTTTSSLEGELQRLNLEEHYNPSAMTPMKTTSPFLRFRRAQRQFDSRHGKNNEETKKTISKSVDIHSSSISSSDHDDTFIEKNQKESHGRSSTNTLQDLLNQSSSLHDRRVYPIATTISISTTNTNNDDQINSNDIQRNEENIENEDIEIEEVSILLVEEESDDDDNSVDKDDNSVLWNSSPYKPAITPCRSKSTLEEIRKTASTGALLDIKRRRHATDYFNLIPSSPSSQRVYTDGMIITPTKFKTVTNPIDYLESLDLASSFLHEVQEEVQRFDILTKSMSMEQDEIECLHNSISSSSIDHHNLQYGSSLNNNNKVIHEENDDENEDEVNDRDYGADQYHEDLFHKHGNIEYNATKKFSSVACLNQTLDSDKEIDESMLSTASSIATSVEEDNIFSQIVRNTNQLKEQNLLTTDQHNGVNLTSTMDEESENICGEQYQNEVEYSIEYADEDNEVERKLKEYEGTLKGLYDEEDYNDEDLDEREDEIVKKLKENNQLEIDSFSNNDNHYIGKDVRDGGKDAVVRNQEEFENEETQTIFGQKNNDVDNHHIHNKENIIHQSPFQQENQEREDNEERGRVAFYYSPTTTIDSLASHSTNQHTISPKLTASEKASVNPRAQNGITLPHSPSGLCLSPLTRTPMQARKWRTYAAQAAVKSENKKKQSTKKKRKIKKKNQA